MTLGNILLCLFLQTETKVKVKEMENQKKDYEQPWRGSFLVIARKLGCTPKYVSLVLRDKRPVRKHRDTELVKQIRETAAQIEVMLSPVTEE